MTDSGLERNVQTPILIVGNDPEFAGLLRSVLKSRIGYTHVLVENDFASGINAVIKHRPGIILIGADPHSEHLGPAFYDKLKKQIERRNGYSPQVIGIAQYNSSKQLWGERKIPKFPWF